MYRSAVVLLVVAASSVLASTTPYIAWHVQAGNGCSPSKTVADFYFPLNTCYNNGSNSYRYTCPNGVGGSPINTTYPSTDCSGSGTQDTLTLSCVNNGTYGYRYECVALQDKLAKNERRVIQFTDGTCLGKPVYFISATEGACVSAFSTSLKVSCSNGKYTRLDYGTSDCTGIPTNATAADGACLSGQAVECSFASSIAASFAVLLAAVLAVVLSL